MNEKMQPGQWAWIRRPDYSKSEIRSLTYCPVCAQDYHEQLEPLWANCVERETKVDDIYNKCHVCSGERMKRPLNHVTCEIRNDRVEIFRAGKIIGTVVSVGDSEPEVTLFPPSPDDIVTLTFNDFAIIEDNWNQLEEMRK